MDINIEKSLALLQETDDLVWFTTGTGDDIKIWEGTEEGMRENWADYLNGLEDGDPDNEMSFEDWLEDNGTEVDVEEYDERTSDWLVYTDSEADDAWDESLENYIDECLEIPQSIRNYFDRESWKSDARMDGRGHSLSGYDGNECEQEVNGTTYYLYRQN